MSIAKDLKLDTSYRGLLAVAVPVSLGAFVQFVVAFTDNYFVAKLDGNSMSAVSYVGLIYITLVMISIGLSNAAQILIARRKGEGKTVEIGSILSNAIYIAIALALVLFVVMRFILPESLEILASSEDVRSKMMEFIAVRSYGLFFFTLTIVLNAFWAGIADTRVMILTSLITALVNILLDYVLVFGHGGMPAMGIKGAALATIIAEACGFFFLFIYTLRHRISKVYSVAQELAKVPLRYSADILKLGFPIMFQMLISLGAWVAFYSIVSALGEKQFQASFIVRNMYMLAYVSVGGMSTTIKTYVSGLIAEERQGEIVRVIKKTIWLNFCGIVILSHGLWLYPEWIAERFSMDAETIEHTVNTMIIVLPAMLVFSASSVLLGAVEGSGNADKGFYIELITIIVYLVAVCFMVYKWKWKIQYVWTSDYLYFILIAGLSLLYLKNGKWKYKKI
ncbi:MAG: MATE family efflux transporter [Flavobacteriales bacterium]|nr:MATE family efflux transporter [Flavobacteriales bacterium]